jgi:hypothetical protein
MSHTFDPELIGIDQSLQLMNRMGRFTVTIDFVKTAPDNMMRLMGKMIVMRCECLYFSLNEYVAISYMFDELKPGEKIPTYNIVGEYDENGEIKFTAEREK